MEIMDLDRFNSIQKCYDNIILSNDDFFNMDLNGILFVDPPYVDMDSGTYKFSKEQYDKFLGIIKQYDEEVIYTDIYDEDRLNNLGDNWNYQILRDTIGKGKPGANKNKYRQEVIYYNFKIKNSLW